ncbi:hypothetical protein L1999_27920 [Neobacillus drentensis]|uniref:hypothetical protein n=1 Tax=Neobacillus drentensis TaxID=220684 RepID=UPI001F313CC2|nr:hypothetical protein [Neobacillus drentensis]ULT56808.1 hypothetical protein L1999_27920 [Neobacillus drentensis]
MEKIHFLVSEFFFSIALCVVALFFALRSEVFPINVVFLGLIAGSLIDINLRSIYKNKAVKISGYLEHTQRIVEKETSM